jgi:hypothetical protein
VAYYSHKLTDTEKRYSAREQEFLALKNSLLHWSHYLRDKPFEVHTDHDSLRHLHTQPTLSRREAGWLVRYMCDYNFTIKHIPGKTNVVADALSRRADHSVNFTDVWVHTVASTVLSTQEPGSFEKLRSAYPDDPETAPIYAKCLGGEPPDGYRLEGGLLFKEQPDGADRLFIPTIGRLRI